MSEARRHSIRQAQNWLAVLARGSTQYVVFLDLIREGVRGGGYTLADIGTNEDQLEALQTLGAKTKAEQWLRVLRRGTTHVQPFLRNLRDELRKGGLTPADIGTSEDELAQL